MTDDWYQRAFHRESAEYQLFLRFTCPRTTPQILDALLADGWRHFGSQFFRDLLGVVENRFRMILPLRIDLHRFSPKKSQRRVLRANQDLTVCFQPAHIDGRKETLFYKHRNRFTHNIPETLSVFLSDTPDLIPCETRECAVFDHEKLVAVSFFDIGDQATSSVYAIFDPACAKRSLGIFTLLQEINHSIALNKRYLYLGYAHVVPSFYEYKKHFTGTEFYDWCGRWLPLETLSEETFPHHPLEGRRIHYRGFEDEENLG